MQEELLRYGKLKRKGKQWREGKRERRKVIEF